MFLGLGARRRFTDLNEQEILALAISSEEDDARIYLDYAARLAVDFPSTAKMFEQMADEENRHRRALISEYERCYGTHILLIRREHISGYYSRWPVWLVHNLGIARIREEFVRMEADAARFYMQAMARTHDSSVRRLLGDLAQREQHHEKIAAELTAALQADAGGRIEDQTAHRQFVLTWVQPGLAGLMDGSVSTLAPVFATAFATQSPSTTLLVGLAAAVGAGISMGFTEAAHDDGVISGRGSPVKRGIASGVMTTLGGLGHALPYLIPSFWWATVIAIAMVFVELWAIVWIQNRYMETPVFRAMFQVILGGSLVLAAGILIGSG